MTAIIFAKPRHEYASYRDLYALIDLSGFPTCFIDEIDPQSDNAYVITILNGEIPEGGYPSARAKIAQWDLEYRREPYAPLANVERWHMDKWQAKMLGARYVPMGSHAKLCPEMTPKRDIYDAAYIGYFAASHRRQVMAEQLRQRGVKLSPPQAWGDERHALLRNSASYLHVHQHDDMPAVPALRLVVAAAYGLPFISETVADAGIFQKHILQSDYNALAYNMAIVTQHHWERDLMPKAHSLHQKLCIDFTFKKSVEVAL